MQISNSLIEKTRQLFRDVPDFPKPGILFKDIAPLLKDVQFSKQMISEISEILSKEGIDALAAIESRGFIYGMPLAMSLNIPFILLRKKGKLPGNTFQVSYGLEYAEDIMEMQKDALNPGMNVWIHDDVLATGGTAKAAASLIQQGGGHVAGYFFLAEIKSLQGKSKLSEKIYSIIQF